MRRLGIGDRRGGTSVAVRALPGLVAVALVIIGRAVPDPAGWETDIVSGMARTPALTLIMEWVSAAGSSASLAVVIVGVSVIARRSPIRWIPAVAYVGAIVSYSVLKLVIGRLRPELGAVVPGDAFPSGHATQAAAVMLTCAFVLAGRRRSPLVWAAAVAAVLVGISRVYLEAHWPADVLAGWALGASWFVALTAGVSSEEGRSGP